MKNILKIIIILTLVGVLNVAAAAEGLSPEQLVQKIQENKALITSYEATMVVSMSGPYIQGQKVQKAKVYFQSPDTLRTDVFEPIHQVTLQGNGRSQSFDSLGNAKDEAVGSDKNKFSDPAALMPYVDLSVANSGDIVQLVAIPKANVAGSPFQSGYINKVVFSLSPEADLVQKAEVFDVSNNIFITVQITSQTTNNVSFPIQSSSIINIPNGNGTMEVSTRYEKLKLNVPLAPELFDPEIIKKTLAEENTEL